MDLRIIRNSISLLTLVFSLVLLPRTFADPTKAPCPSLMLGKNPAITLDISSADYRAAEKSYLLAYAKGAPLEQIVTPVNKAGLSDAQMKAIYSYTIGDYIPINKALRSDSVNVELNKNLDLQNEILVLRTGIRKIEDMTGVIYRGSNFTSQELDQYRVGSVVTLRGITSASLSKGVADNFNGNVLFVFKVKHGKSISDYSQDASEDEIVLDHLSTMKVISRRTAHKRVPVGDDPTGPTKSVAYEVIHAEEVP